MSDLLTIKEAAKYLRMNPLTVYRLASKGKVPAVKVGRHWRIHHDALETWLRPKAPRQALTILVVDDEETIGNLFKRSLSHEDYHVVAVPGGGEALGLLGSSDIGLIFLDLRMPGMDGAETFRGIRSIDPQVPVIIITGYPHDDLMAKVLEIGPVGVMRKPFGPQDVQQAVATFCKGGRDHQTQLYPATTVDGLMPSPQENLRYHVTLNAAKGLGRRGLTISSPDSSPRFHRGSE